MLTTGYHSFQISIIVFHLRCEAVWGDKFVKDCWVVTCDRKVQDRGTRGKWPWKEKGQDNWAHTLSLCSPRRPQPPPALHGHVPFSNGPCDQRGISSSPSLAAATSLYQVNWREGRRSCCSFSSTGSWLGHNGAACCVSYVCLCSSILSCPLFTQIHPHTHGTKSWTCWTPDPDPTAGAGVWAESVLRPAVDTWANGKSWEDAAEEGKG